MARIVNPSDYSPQPKTPTKTTKPLNRPSSSKSSPCRSPRNPANAVWAQEQQRRIFLEHLRNWSLRHDSSLHFHGEITLCSAELQRESLELGRSIVCNVWQHCCALSSKKRVIIRLFEPKEDGRYRMVIRCGAGWITAKEYLVKEYFNHHRMYHRKLRLVTHFERPTAQRSMEPNYKLLELDSVTIAPLFHPFTRLPVELQQEIFGFVIGKTALHHPGTEWGPGFGIYDSGLGGSLDLLRCPSTRVPTVLGISKMLNEYLIPWIYKTTNFHFECQALTNFTYRAGPRNRAHIRQITLAYGIYALVHCVRWFAPDEILELFEPEMRLNPPGMQFFWRCQLRDLTHEIRLAILTIDTQDIPIEDVPFVVRTLRQSFGHIQYVHLTRYGIALESNDEVLQILKRTQGWTWGQLCQDAFTRYRDDMWHSVAFSAKRKTSSIEDLDRDMGVARNFFASIPA